MSNNNHKMYQRKPQTEHDPKPVIIQHTWAQIPENSIRQHYKQPGTTIEKKNTKDIFLKERLRYPGLTKEEKNKTSLPQIWW